MSSSLNNLYVITEFDTTNLVDTASIIENFCEVHAGLAEAAELTVHLKSAEIKPAEISHDLALIIHKLKAINSRLESQVANLQVTNIQLARANEYFRQNFQKIIKKTLDCATPLSDSNEIKAKYGTFNTRSCLTIEESFGVVPVKKDVTAMVTGFAKEFLSGKKSESSRDKKLISVYEMFKE